MDNNWFYEYFINELKAIGIKRASKLSYEVVDTLPPSGDENTIYFVKSDSGSTNNLYDEYAWVSSSNTFEKIGSTLIDGSATQPDWNQNDNTQPDYIKNRPSIAADDDVLDLLVGIGAITPITNLSGEILISSSNEIYYL